MFMKNIIIIIILLLCMDLFAKRLFTVESEIGFPISCVEIFSRPEYINLKETILKDMEIVLTQAIEACETATAAKCIEVNTYTQQLEGDENTCFTIATVREL